MENTHESRQDHEINAIAEKKSEKKQETVGTPRDLETVNESNNSPQVDVVSTGREELPLQNTELEKAGTSTYLADDKNEGNTLNDVVTMHTTNCDDDYSPTLAICDIFSKTKSASGEKDTECLIDKEEEVKDEFLIIDLDTCQTERGFENENGSKALKVCQSKIQSKSPAKSLILVNLSSDDVQTDFLNTSCASNALGESNSIQSKQVCDSTYDPCFSNAIEKCIIDHKESNDEPKEEVKLHVPLGVGFNCGIGLQNKSLVLNDLNVSQESSISKEAYASEDSFCASDMNEISLHSNQNGERSPVFYSSEVYTKISDEKDKSSDRLYAISNPATNNSAISNDGTCEYYDYANHRIFENLLPSSHFDNPGSHDVFEGLQSRVAPHYSFDKSNLKMMLNKKTEFPPMYGLIPSTQENKQHLLKAVKSETNIPYRPPFYSAVQDHTPFFHSPYLPSYSATYPYNFQHVGESNPPYITNYSEWNSWSDSTIYEVTVNPYKAVNVDSDHHQAKSHWSGDTNMSDLYQDSHFGVKSNQTDIDSEATEDADETDGIPMLLDSSTDFSTCDNLSTMSVMSGSCFSDTSSVMAPFSPTEFTPPPSTSNTPIPPAHYSMNTFEDTKFGASFMSDNAYSEPLHLNSPLMCSAPSFKIKQEDNVPQLLNHGHHQGIQRHYPSMADMHHSRSNMSISSTSCKFEEELSNFTDCRKSYKNQIQSDKISTSTSRAAFDTRQWNQGACYDVNESLETFPDYTRQGGECSNESRKSRHNEPLKQSAIRIMSQWYEQHLDNPYPTKEDKMKMALEGGITVTQVKSWFANKRNRTNNTKPKVQKRAMKEKLKKLFQDLKHSRPDSVDDSLIIKQLSGIIQT